MREVCMPAVSADETVGMVKAFVGAAVRYVSLV